MPSDDSIEWRIAQRIRSLRGERQWPLEELATRSRVSRASLSRIENGEVSPTAAVLARICSAFGLTLSRLMVQVEEGFPALLPAEQQLLWTDPETGYERRAVSPPAPGLSGEVIACELKSGTRIAYDRPPRTGLEHHLVMREGALTLTADGVRHVLKPGDCLRYRVHGESLFETPPESGASYYLFMV
ncbi:helix-turn-helix domain-containing protein [Aestuariivirga sp.]|uniref:helix-turn-helix domain-containing protein n=1 Tax=Aestuariivirga sp. TaxID=2650926 RepID=UPI003BA94C75